MKLESISPADRKPRLHRWQTISGSVLAAGLAAVPACAGPPFVSDDPERTELHQGEICNFAGSSREDGVTSAQLGVDIHYGGAKDVQLTAVLPLHIETATPLDVGNVQIEAKSKLLHQKEETAWVDLNFFPARVPAHRTRIAPRADPVADLGAARFRQVFGVRRRRIHDQSRPGKPQLLGIARAGHARDRSRIPARAGVFQAGPTVGGNRPLHGMNLGTVIHLSGPFSLLGSFGPGLNRRQTIFYSALKLDL